MVAVVTATGANTFFGRTAKLLAGAGSVSHFQRAVMKIGDFLIILALVLVVILVASRLFDMRGHYDRIVLLRLAEIVLILLVASVPVAMPAGTLGNDGSGRADASEKQSNRFST